MLALFSAVSDDDNSEQLANDEPQAASEGDESVSPVRIHCFCVDPLSPERTCEIRIQIYSRVRRHFQAAPFEY